MHFVVQENVHTPPEIFRDPDWKIKFALLRCIKKKKTFRKIVLILKYGKLKAAAH